PSWSCGAAVRRRRALSGEGRRPRRGDREPRRPVRPGRGDRSVGTHGRLTHAAGRRASNARMPKLTFHGAARTVTGSKHLLEVDGRRILVDCGQFQGRKDLRLLNWTAFPFDPAPLEALVLPHAHLDPSGLLPRLSPNGFKGRIYCTPGTLELCGLVLPDAG